MLRLTSVFRMIPKVIYNSRNKGDHSIPTLKALSLPTRTLSSKDNEPENDGMVETRRTYIPYRNHHGEEMLFEKQYPPREYAFVPSGNSYVTRHCRTVAKELNQKIYAKYRSESRKRPAQHEGLFVPKNILAMVESDFDRKKAAAEEKWLQNLDEQYPNMPPIDRTEITMRCYSPRLDRTSKPRWAKDLLIIQRYVLSKYTAFNSVNSRKDDAQVLRSKARGEADKILSTWARGLKHLP
ncbi:hypothetical protein F5Y03DRAFT_377916 [Xylaria venustula]|nr:hypothetical protein F5Y03DRAFT_377916 [Xylaria venustula]